jgi:hypothetical protein
LNFCRSEALAFVLQLQQGRQEWGLPVQLNAAEPVIPTVLGGELRRVYDEAGKIVVKTGLNPVGGLLTGVLLRVAGCRAVAAANAPRKRRLAGQITNITGATFVVTMAWCNISACTRIARIFCFREAIDQIHS